MNLPDIFPNVFAPAVCAVTIAGIHKFLGWSLLVSAAVGFIPGLIVGYLLSFVLVYVSMSVADLFRGRRGRD
ncbi:MAG: hypothetical protein C0485_10330 [Pirellula sp.]|nr:hypothetical protein [Pirellula sp.]